MAYPYGNYGYNFGGYSNQEFFGLNGYETDPSYRLMAHPEIPAEQPQYYDYPDRNNQQIMHQIFFEDGQHNNRQYPYAHERIPFELNQRVELPSHRISVSIRLSRRVGSINNLISALDEQGLSCEVDRNVVTVTGYPSSTRPSTSGLTPGEEEFWGIVVRITGDSGAEVLR